MTVVTFAMSGNVRGKGRPRTAVRGGHATIYTDSKTVQYERSVRQIAGKAMGAIQPFVGPLSVSLQLRLGLPKSMTKKLRAAILAGEEPYFGNVDCDNAAKAVLDAMNSVCFVDDRQVVRLFVSKIPHERPGVDVRVEALAEPTP